MMRRVILLAAVGAALTGVGCRHESDRKKPIEPDTAPADPGAVVRAFYENIPSDKNPDKVLELFLSPDTPFTGVSGGAGRDVIYTKSAKELVAIAKTQAPTQHVVDSLTVTTLGDSLASVAVQFHTAFVVCKGVFTLTREGGDWRIAACVWESRVREPVPAPGEKEPPPTFTPTAVVPVTPAAPDKQLGRLFGPNQTTDVLTAGGTGSSLAPNPELPRVPNPYQDIPRNSVPMPLEAQRLTGGFGTPAIVASPTLSPIPAQPVTLTPVAPPAPVSPVVVDLTGVWSCDDGATYFIRQEGISVSWLCESKDGGREFTHVFRGEVKVDPKADREHAVTIIGNWADVPKGKCEGHGVITLNVCLNEKGEAPGMRLESRVGSFFLGKAWTRVERKWRPNPHCGREADHATADSVDTGALANCFGWVRDDQEPGPREAEAVRRHAHVSL